MARTRCEIHGLGVVSPIGVSVGEFWSSALSGRSGITRDAGMRRAGLRSQVCGRVDTRRLRAAPGWDNEWLTRPRVIQLALTAAAQAWEAVFPSTESRRRTGLVFSSAMGIVEGVDPPSRGAANRDCRGSSHAALGEVLSATFDIAGPVIGISDGCTGGLDAFITACELIESGDIDTCLMVASDAPLDTLTLAAMDNLGVLSRRNESPEESCPSFSSERQGMVMAEGAAALVLKRPGRNSAESALPLAAVEAYASVSNCRSMVSLRDAAEDMARCVRLALERAGLDPREIDHLNVHGSGTLQNDEAEARALLSVFGSRIKQLPTVAFKSLAGHALAASNALELVGEVLILRTGNLPPAMGHGEKNPWGLRLITREPLVHPALRGLKLNHGFGGFHSCAVLSKA